MHPLAFTVHLPGIFKNPNVLGARRDFANKKMDPKTGGDWSSVTQLVDGRLAKEPWLTLRSLGGFQQVNKLVRYTFSKSLGQGGEHTGGVGRKLAGNPGRSSDHHPGTSTWAPEPRLGQERQGSGARAS